MSGYGKTIAWAVLAASLPLLPGGAFADQTDERLRKLEKNQAEIYHTLEGKKEAGLMTHITERITLSGLIEVELIFEDLDLADGSESGEDIELATVQLGFEAAVNENFGASLIVLYEEGGSGDVEVDEATAHYGRGGWSARVGRQYLPFGVFPSHFISDPLTLELGEAQETAIRAGYGGELFEVALFGAAGDADKAGDGQSIDDWGASLTVSPIAPILFGVSYHSDLADTGAELADDYIDRTGGWSVVAVAGAGPFEVSAEYLAATDRFNAADVDGDGDGEGDRPAAWNVEAAWHALDSVEIAGRVEGSDEFSGQPEIQYGACVSWGPWENVSLSLEYIHGKFDERFGEGAGSRDLVATQLAVEF